MNFIYDRFVLKNISSSYTNRRNYLLDSILNRSFSLHIFIHSSHDSSRNLDVHQGWTCTCTWRISVFSTLVCLTMYRYGKEKLDFFDSLELHDKSNFNRLVWQDKGRLYFEIHGKNWRAKTVAMPWEMWGGEALLFSTVPCTLGSARSSSPFLYAL